MRARDRRVARLQQAIDGTPVRRGILDEAYEWFTGFGELPDDDHVAFEVVQKALRGGEDAPLDDEATARERVRTARLAYHKRERPGEQWPPSVRGMLFDEALFEVEPTRGIARAAIACEVAWGGDVENRAFAARHGIPGYGCVGLHVIGYYQKLAIPPYEDQAHRLFVRLDNVRGQMPHDDPRWSQAQAEAMVAFLTLGELPKDALQLEALLVNLELDLLRANRRGKDVKLGLRLLDQIARSEGKKLETSVAKLVELAKAKLLMGGDKLDPRDGEAAQVAQIEGQSSSSS